MGYSYRNKGQIKDFWPEDDDNTMYIPHGESLGEILFRAQEKWPGVNIHNIRIEAEKIHTSCLTYDLYDPSDYTNFLKITKEEQ